MFVEKLLTHRTLYLIESMDETNKEVYFFLLCGNKDSIMLSHAKNKEQIDLREYGEIVYSGFGRAPERLKTYFKQKYS